MDETLKSELTEITSVIKALPENLQLRAFEMLLQDYFDGRLAAKASKQRTIVESVKKDVPQRDDEKPVKSSSVTAISFPLRLKAFMKKYNLTMEHLDKLFHVEDGAVEPIWSSDETKHSRAQIEVALMEALRHAMLAGEFTFDPEDIRQVCETKRCYDRTNFKANFKNNAKLFAAVKDSGPMSLSDEGMKRLAEMIVSRSEPQ